MNPFDQPSVIASAIFVFTAGALVFNLLPLLLGATADALALDPQQLGVLGSTYMGAFALTSIPAVALLQWVNWRAIGLGAGMLAVTALLAASQMRTYAGTLSVFLLAGIAMSLLFALGNRVLGATSDPDRSFAFAYWVMLIVPAALIFLFAHAIVPNWGYAGMYVTTGLLVAALLAGCFQLSAEGPTSVVSGERVRTTPAIALGLSSMILYYVGLGGVWAFIERMGVARGIGADTVATILSVGLIVTAFASLVPIFTEGRFTRGTMLLAGALVICPAMVLLAVSHGLPGFLIGALIFNFVWGTATVYISAIIAAADRTGRFLALIGGAIASGATIGPTLAGGLVRDDNFTGVFTMCALAVITSAALAIAAERKAIREYSKPEESTSLSVP